MGILIKQLPFLLAVSTCEQFSFRGLKGNCLSTRVGFAVFVGIVWKWIM